MTPNQYCTLLLGSIKRFAVAEWILREHPTDEFKQKAAADGLGDHQAQVRRALDQLVALGMLTRAKRGGDCMYACSDCEAWDVFRAARAALEGAQKAGLVAQ